MVERYCAIKWVRENDPAQEVVRGAMPVVTEEDYDALQTRLAEAERRLIHGSTIVLSQASVGQSLALQQWAEMVEIDYGTPPETVSEVEGEQ